MENKPLIIWEKWVDPFGGDLDETKWTDYNNDIIDPSDIDNEELEENKPTIKSTKPVRVVASPLGLIPYNEYTASGKIFNFWLGHTNFNISENIKSILEKSQGVEILDIFTRYRFRIAIGKCFVDSEVISLINENIYSTLNQSL
jgi:hypothetical protein